MNSRDSRIETLKELVRRLSKEGGDITLFDVGDLTRKSTQILRESFYSEVDDTLLYYYLPLGHFFSRTPPSAMTDEKAALIWSGGSPLKLKKNPANSWCEGGKSRVTFTVYRVSSEDAAIAVDDTTAIGCITLAEIFTEIWYLAHVGLNRIDHSQILQLRLSAYRHSDIIKTQHPNYVSIDVICSTFFTATCRLEFVENNRPLQRYAVEVDRRFGCDGPTSEFKKADFLIRCPDSNIESALTTLACFPSFYEDFRCYGTLLVSRDKKLCLFNDVTFIEANDVYGEDDLPFEVVDALQNGTLPVIRSAVESGTFGFDYKLLIMFGAKTDVPGADAVTATALFILGIRCNDIQGKHLVACSIARAISSALPTLQKELYSATTQNALLGLKTAHEDLKKQNAKLMATRDELLLQKAVADDALRKLDEALKEVWKQNEHFKRSQALFDRIRGPLAEVTQNLSDAQTQLTQLHGVFHSPYRGVYARADRMQKFFNKGELSIFGHRIKIGHSPSDTHNDPSNAVIKDSIVRELGIQFDEFVLIAMICCFMGRGFAEEKDWRDKDSPMNLAAGLALLGNQDEPDSAINAYLKTLIEIDLRDLEPRCTAATADDIDYSKLDFQQVLFDCKSTFLTIFKPIDGKAKVLVGFLSSALPRLKIEKEDWIEKDIEPGFFGKTKYLLCGDAQSLPFPTIADFIELLCGLACLGDNAASDGSSVILKSIRQDNEVWFVMTRDVDFLEDKPSQHLGLLFNNKGYEWLGLYEGKAVGDFFAPLSRAIRHGTLINGWKFESGGTIGELLYLHWKCDASEFILQISRTEVRWAFRTGAGSV